MLSMRTILIAVAATALCISGTNASGKQHLMRKDFHARRAEAAKRYSDLRGRQTTGGTVKNITFSNPKVSG